MAAVEGSVVGVAKARALAAKAGVEIDFHTVDLLDWEMMVEAKTLTADFPTPEIVECFEGNVLLDEGESHQGLSATLRLVARERAERPAHEPPHA